MYSTPGDNNFISRQEASIARWERRREILQERERNRMLSVLHAMHLLGDSKTADGKENVKTDDELIKLTSTKSKEDENKIIKSEKSEIKQKQSSDEPNSAHISFETATINSKNGKYSKKLKMGLIAEPLKL